MRAPRTSLLFLLGVLIPGGCDSSSPATKTERDAGTDGTTARMVDATVDAEINGGCGLGRAPVGNECLVGLTDLVPEVGQLVPEFEPSTSNYALEVPLSHPTVVFSFSYPAGALVRIDGSKTDGTEAAVSTPVTAAGEINFTVSFGATSRNYRVTYRRGYEYVLKQVLASNNSNTDRFGSAIAVQGDVLAIGSRTHDIPEVGGNNNFGAVHIYNLDAQDDTWKLDETLHPQSAKAVRNMQFGNAVSISGSTMAVGAFIHEGLPDLGEVGGVFIYKLENGKWVEDDFLTATFRSGGDRFGERVALWNDTLVVGSQREDSASATTPADNSLENSGAIYVFERNNGNWDAPTLLKSPTPQTKAHFGSRLDVYGNRIAVGAHREDGPGAVHLFEKEGQVWMHKQKIEHVPNSSNQFGLGVALSETYLAIAVPRRGGVGGPESGVFPGSTGALDLYANTTGSWTRHDYLRMAHPATQDRFPSSISINGTTLVAGASSSDFVVPGTGDKITNMGRATVFELAGGSYRAVQDLLADVPEEDASFGSAVASEGDWVFVAAEGRTQSGRVYVFKKQQFE